MRRIIAVCLAALVAVWVAGCAKPSAKDILDKTGAAYGKLASLRMEGDNSGELRIGGQWRSSGANTIVEFQKPNKFRQEAPNADQPVFVTDGKKGYVYDPQSKNWFSVAADKVEEELTIGRNGAGPLLYATNEKPFSGAKNAKLVGNEKVGDVDCYIVEFEPERKAPMQGMETAKLTERIWVAKTDWLVRKRVVVTKVPADAKMGRPQAATVTMTAVISKIEPDAKLSSSRFALPAGAKPMAAPTMAPPPGR